MSRVVMLDNTTLVLHLPSDAALDWVSNPGSADFTARCGLGFLPKGPGGTVAVGPEGLLAERSVRRCSICFVPNIIRNTGLGG